VKARIVGERQSDIVAMAELEPRDDWVLVKVHASGMCTEYKSWLAGSPRDNIGHEGAGEVVAVDRPGRVKEGDRVTVMAQHGCGMCRLCRSGDYIYCENAVSFADLFGSDEGAYTFARYVLKPSWLLLPIPPGVSYERATMAIDGIGASFGGMQAIGASAFDTVLITGLGPVGLGGIINARFRGARVLAVEPAPWRAALGRSLGAEEVFDPESGALLERIAELTDGVGVDCAVDCSGTVQGERLCIDAVRRRGRVSFVGENRQPVPITVSPDLIRKGLRVQGTWLYNLADYDQVMQVVAESPLIDKLISHVMPMSQIQEAFGLLAAGESAKIVLHPWE
jgi:L-iditol 2-dehydrogenase